jgi:hypothetical protein
MPVVATWLLITIGSATRPPAYIPFATEKACERACKKILTHPLWGMLSARLVEPSHDER